MIDGSQSGATGRLSSLSQWGGMFFCTMWLLAMLGFPIVKGMWIGYVPVVLGACLSIFLCLPEMSIALNNWVSRPSPRRFLLWTVGTGLLLRLMTLAILPMQLVSDQGLIHAKALQIVAGEGFGKSAFGPPGQPFLLAGWYWLTTPHPCAAYLLGILLGTAAIWLTYATAMRIVSPLAARWAAVLTATMPTLVFTSAIVHTPALLVLLVLGAIMLSLDAAKDAPKSWWPVLGLGCSSDLARWSSQSFCQCPC